MRFHQIGKRFVTTLLMREARLVVRKYKPRVVGVTGTVGKTAAKDAGFRATLTSWATEKENYLSHLMSIVEQYRASGLDDDEILKLFPKK